MRKKFFIIDGFALIYRAYFAFGAKPLITKEGLNINAIFGFFNSLFALISREKPEYMLIALDKSTETFRHKLYKEYKATRQKMPDELREQLPILFEMIADTNLAVLEQEGYEADDIIATVSDKAGKDGFDVFIYSSDKDLAQLVNENVFIYDPKTYQIFDNEAIFEKFGVRPDQIADYLALMGDSADNVPGVPKIGKKTAVLLLNEYDSMKKLLKNVDFVTKKAVKASLIENKDLALLSKRLVELKPDNLDIDFNMDDFIIKDFNIKALAEKFKIYKMFKLIKTLTTLQSNQKEVEIIINRYKKENVSYTIVENEANLKAILKTEGKHIALNYVLSSSEKNKIVGLSFSFEPQKSYFISNNSSSNNENTQSLLDLFPDDDLKYKNNETILFLFNHILSKKMTIIGENVKELFAILKNFDIEINSTQKYFDVTLADYILKSANNDHTVITSVYKQLSYELISEKDIFGTGHNKTNAEEIDLETLSVYVSEKADFILRLYNLQQLDFSKNEKLKKIFETIELPLIPILFKMEQNGVLIDKELLESLLKSINGEMDILRNEIYAISNEDFNIDSPKQLGSILFEKLNLKHGRKGKNGNYSTDNSVLEKLSYQGEEIATLLIQWREKSKLKNTYIEGLIKSINQEDKRIHTTFNQTVATTGRLSSSEPNIQSIPIKTKDGEKIRRSFIPRKGYSILAADYSQIELRILAHYCNDENLIAAFNNGIDIHKMTASIIFGKEIEDITKSERIKAKTTNFSVIYGKSKFGLADDLKIPFAEASQFIDNYFLKFPKIEDYIKNTEMYATQYGFVETLYGRKREIHEVFSQNKNSLNAALRAAVNAPIQGTAADIIKMAMINMEKKLKNEPNVSLLLQVHDELIFEVKNEEIERLKPIIKNVMVTAVSLKVPLDVNVGIGDNWLEAH